MGVTKFVWDPVFDCVVSELDENNAVKAVYEHEPQPYGGLLSQQRGATTHYHHHDALGSTRFLTDSSGNVTDTYLYDAWGNNVASTGTTVNPFRWVGKYGYYTDDGTGQVYVRARMYQPAVARWSSIDPLGYFDGVNLHTYADNVAPQKIDPTGLYCICCTFEQAEVIFSTDVCGLVNAVDLCKQEAKLRSDASFGKYPVKVLSVGKNRCNVVAQDKYWLCGIPVQQSGRIVEDCFANCTAAEHVSIGIGDAFPLTEGRGGKGGSLLL